MESNPPAKTSTGKRLTGGSPWGSSGAVKESHRRGLLTAHGWHVVTTYTLHCIVLQYNTQFNTIQYNTMQWNYQKKQYMCTYKSRDMSILSVTNVIGKVGDFSKPPAVDEAHPWIWGGGCIQLLRRKWCSASAWSPAPGKGWLDQQKDVRPTG